MLRHADHVIVDRGAYTHMQYAQYGQARRERIEETFRSHMHNVGHETHCRARRYPADSLLHDPVLDPRKRVAP